MVQSHHNWGAADERVRSLIIGQPGVGPWVIDPGAIRPEIRAMALWRKAVPQAAVYRGAQAEAENRPGAGLPAMSQAQNRWHADDGRWAHEENRVVWFSLEGNASDHHGRGRL